LQKLSAARILRTLDFGLMMAVAYPINRAEREAVANFLGTKSEESPLPASAFCAANVSIMSGPANDTWAGWSPSASNARYQSAERAGLAPGQVRRLKLKWALGFPGDVTAFAAPSVLNGTLFVGSASGAVEAVDAETGCTHWVFQANGPVRAAILPVPNGSGTTLIVTDLIGWAYALDARSGHLIWKKRIDEHEATRLTGSSAALNGVVFIPAASWEETRSLEPQYVCCTFRGSVTALRVRDGSLVWKTYTIDPPQKTGTSSAGVIQWGPSGAPVWSSPTVDTKRGVLYVSTGDNYSVPPTTTSDAVMALDLKTGRIVWSSQVLANDAYTSACRTKGANCPSTNGPDFDFGSSAILVRAPNGKEMLVAGQKSGMVYAIDPDAKGKILWQTRVGKGGLNGGVQWGMASDEQKVYAAVNDTSGVMNTAGPVGGATFDPVKGGGLTSLRSAAAGMQSRPVRRADAHSRRGIFRLARWPRAGVQHGGRRDALGFRYGRPDVFHGERNPGQRRLDRRRRPGRCRWHDVRQLRIPTQRRDAGQRAAGLCAGGFKVAQASACGFWS
jgi:polyvinyl alcohol dehydrogenase (cytochrome)